MFVAREKVLSTSLIAVALGWLAFSVIMFVRGQAQEAKLITGVAIGKDSF
jgi:hypothetical protein